MGSAFGKFLLAFLLLTALFPVKSYCQDLTGIWRGYFITDGGDQYKYELQVEQNKKNTISGVSYSYLDTRFYGKAALLGSFNKNTSSALIQETKTVEVRMAGGSVACIMKCIFNYARSGKEEFLEGTFESMYEKTDPIMGIKRGGNCGGGKVYLRKVTTSDFYVEPFLRNKTQTPPAETETKKTKEPPKPKVVTKAPHKNPPAVKTKPKTTGKTPVVTKKEKRDTIIRKPNAPVIVEKPEEKKVFIPPVPEVTRSRENNLVQTFAVTNEEITIRLYDNGEVDDDTVSVYMDGKPLALNKRLSTVPITLTIKMDESHPEHTLVMYAENMGRIPPNTSLMIVQDGDRRHQVSITSTEQKNAMVRFRYQKKPD